jgi:hypothetical protein
LLAKRRPSPQVGRGYLAYARGGTNVGTAWTQGSIFFAGATTFLQDNAHLFWDAVNNYLGVRTNAPANAVDVIDTVAGPLGLRVKNLSAAGGNTHASLFVENSASFGQLFKAGAGYVGYKNIAANDLGYYNTGGNISILNDAGNINFAPNGLSAAVLTISNSGGRRWVYDRVRVSASACGINGRGIRPAENQDDVRYTGRDIMANTSAFLNPDIWTTGLVDGQPPAGVGSPTLPASFGGPVPPGQVPPPSVNPQVVYTDQSGRGYNPNELKDAWGNGSTAFAQDAANARVRDILPQYGTVLGTPMAPTPAPAAPGAAGAAGVKMPGQAATDPRSSAFFDMLMGRVKGINENIDPNDPIIKGQTDAYAANAERASRSYLSQAAERGGAGTNLDAAARSLAEKAGQSTGSFQASLMGDERSQRRAEIQNLLSMGGSFLSTTDQQALQRELALLNLQENEYQFNTNTQLATSPFAGAFQT